MAAAIFTTFVRIFNKSYFFFCEKLCVNAVDIYIFNNIFFAQKQKQILVLTTNLSELELVKLLLCKQANNIFWYKTIPRKTLGFLC